MRRAEWGQHHHISGKYLGAYAREMAWREDTRRQANGALHGLATAAALGHPVSRVWARLAARELTHAADLRKRRQYERFLTLSQGLKGGHELVQRDCTWGEQVPRISAWKSPSWRAVARTTCEQLTTLMPVGDGIRHGKSVSGNVQSAT
jgi:hypothetical protein